MEQRNVTWEIRIGDVFHVDSRYGNGIERIERWKVIRKSGLRKIKLEVSYTDKDGSMRVLVGQRSMYNGDLIYWARHGKRETVGTGEVIFQEVFRGG